MKSGIINPGMLRSRSQKILGTVAAIFALSVSSIAACACAHHDPKVVTAAAACHSTPVHETPTVVESPTTGRDRYEKDCNCNLSVTQPSVLTRGELKRPVPESKPAAMSVTPSAHEFVTIVTLEKSNVDAFQNDLYASLDTSRTPARAPPRL